MLDSKRTIPFPVWTQLFSGSVRSILRLCGFGRLSLTVMLILSGIFITGCRPENLDDPTAFKGIALPAPISRPHFKLVDTKKGEYDFYEETRGRLTFLFFGYTNCPDVCPVHMANLASSIHRLKYEERQQISVVFVTADPERDTPEVLHHWLGDFDKGFTGLWGTVAQIDSIHEQLNLGKPFRAPPRADGSYAVGHAGQIIVFQANDTAYVTYPFGTRQQDWSNDLPRLLKFDYHLALSSER